MTPPREPRTAAGRTLLAEFHAVVAKRPDVDGILSLHAILAIEAEAEAADAPLRERDYGLVFGKVMQKHPKADVRLVNDVLRTTLDVLAATPAPAHPDEAHTHDLRIGASEYGSPDRQTVTTWQVYCTICDEAGRLAVPAATPAPAPLDVLRNIREALTRLANSDRPFTYHTAMLEVEKIEASLAARAAATEDTE